MARAQPALKTGLRRALQLTVTVAVTWFILDRVGLGLNELQGVDPALWLPAPLPLLAASLLLLVAYFASAAIWGLMVRELGGPSLPLRDSVPMFMIANLGRYLPGKVWQIAGLAALARGRGVPARTAATAAVLGQGIALVAAAAVGMGALLGGPESYRRWGLVGAAAVLAAIGLVAIPPVFRRLSTLWVRLSRTEPEGTPRLAHGLRWLALYTANWVLYALAFWLLVHGMGLGGGVVPVASAFAAAYVLGYAAFFAPAGLGPREGFLIVFLTPHVGVAPAGVVAVVSRIWTTLVELLPAAVFWVSWVGRGTSGPAAGESTGTASEGGGREHG